MNWWEGMKKEPRLTRRTPRNVVNSTALSALVHAEAAQRRRAAESARVWEVSNRLPIVRTSAQFSLKLVELGDRHAIETLH